MLELSANMPVAVVGEASPLGFASFCGGNPDVAPLGTKDIPIRNFLARSKPTARCV